MLCVIHFCSPSCNNSLVGYQAVGGDCFGYSNCYLPCYAAWNVVLWLSMVSIEFRSVVLTVVGFRRAALGYHWDLNFSISALSCGISVAFSLHDGITARTGHVDDSVSYRQDDHPRIYLIASPGSHFVLSIAVLLYWELLPQAITSIQGPATARKYSSFVRLIASTQCEFF